MKVSCPSAFLIKLKRKVKENIYTNARHRYEQNICICILQFRCYKDQHKLKKNILYQSSLNMDCLKM